MQKAKWQILSTRPLPATLITEAAAQNCSIDEVSFIETKPVIDTGTAIRINELFQKPITAVFTSKNAVAAVADVVSAAPGWKVYSIGQATANRITQLFKIPISGTAADAEALAEVIIKDNIKAVVFFCGNIRRDTLPEKLRKANISVEELVVYETKETAATVNGDYDAVLFYSPSAVHSFFSVNKINNDAVLFAIGHTTASAIRKYTNNEVLIAAKPGKEDLVRQMIQYYNTQKREA